MIDMIMIMEMSCLTNGQSLLRNGDFMKEEYREQFNEAGLDLSPLKCTMDFSEFKLNSDGMIPVVVQNYEDQEVLMVAYMNEEAFDITVESGIMTYYSRSRDEIWIKGLTSGHFQHVKSLVIDCDKDTLLAKVEQIGAACHTGNKTCFFTPIA